MVFPHFLSDLLWVGCVPPVKTYLFEVVFGTFQEVGAGFGVSRRLQDGQNGFRAFGKGGIGAEGHDGGNFFAVDELGPFVAGIIPRISRGTGPATNAAIAGLDAGQAIIVGVRPPPCRERHMGDEKRR